MICILVPLLILFLITANVFVLHSFIRTRAGVGLWTALIAAWIAGVGLGIYGGFFCTYRVSERMRVMGAPVPAGVLVREGPPDDPRETDFIMPATLVVASSNVIVVPLALGLFVGVVYWLASALLAGRRPRHSGE